MRTPLLTYKGAWAMGASLDDITRWLKIGKEAGASHTIVVCDTFDYGDYPVHVPYSEDIKDAVRKYDGVNMQKIMEVYSHELPYEEQLKSRRAMNTGYYNKKR